MATQQRQERLVRRLQIGAGLLGLALAAGTANAAGPRAGDVYLQLGGGIYGPEFDIDEGGPPTVQGGPEEAVLNIGLRNGRQLVGIGLSGSTAETGETPENVDLIAFGATIGYKFTDHFGAELAIDVVFPEIQINDVGGGDVIGGDSGAGEVSILQPGILPIALTGIWTFMPEALISPYLGAGVVVTNFESQRAFFSSGDLLELDTGPEFGPIGKAGLYVTPGQETFFFFEGQYQYVDEPEIRDRDGNDVPVDNFEGLYLKFGVGYTF
ncbi:MAG TPA: OmpW family outer membrane protein [Gammaproteobacteria bacterium]|nr:OmpW family outer membrane protein [Gammaproteobacteria bacterium]